MQIHLVKQGKYLIPSLPEDEEKLSKIKNGDIVRVDLVRPRNSQFHRKFMALINVGYEHWTPGELTTQYGPAEKDPERFRKDITILAGYYNIYHRIDGSFRVEAKSISFAKMSQEEFEQLYSKVIDVFLKHITRNQTEESLNQQVERLLHFAG